MTDTVPPDANADVRVWFAAYLGRFPQDATVPRSKLREIASARWRDAKDRQSLQLPRREEGPGVPSKGRRSSQKLADHLNGFEELGLIRRDNAQDAVIITHPVGLRSLAASPARPPHQDSGSGRDGC